MPNNYSKLKSASGKTIPISGYMRFSENRKSAPQPDCDCGICAFLRRPADKLIRPSDTAAWNKLLRDNGVRQLEFEQAVS